VEFQVFDDISKLYQEALRCQQQGLHKESVELLNKIISLKPNEGLGAVYFMLGSSYFLLNDVNQSIDAYINAIFAEPSLHDAYSNIHNILSIHYGKDAKKYYKQILKRIPNFIDNGPTKIRIETSSACNLRCRHCPTGLSYHEMDRSVLSLDAFDIIIKQINDTPSLDSAVLYVGGEPFLNNNIITICKRLKSETGIDKTHLNTNGMLLSPDLCAQMDDAKLDFITVSIDGKSPEENDSIRIGSNYNKIVANVNMLRELSKSTQIKIANTQIKNKKDPDIPVIPDFLKNDFEGLSIYSEYAIKWPSLNIDDKSDMVCVVNDNLNKFCQQPFDNIVIKTNGDILMCCYDLLGKAVIGNIFKDHMRNIWVSAKYKNIRDVMLFGKYKHLPKTCKICPIYTGEKIYLNSDV
jgi:radical SAM protein with 4Fe4S-binding SPASM domain